MNMENVKKKFLNIGMVLFLLFMALGIITGIIFIQNTTDDSTVILVSIIVSVLFAAIL
jgi:1,4-dihydroxy-2-naphthoate octaprenyltransferase